MNDIDYLKWVAEHLVYFQISIYSASMSYMDNNGVYQTVRYEHGHGVPVSDVDLLRGCINEAIKKK